MHNATPGFLLFSLAGISLFGQPASQPIWVVHQVPDDSGVYFVGPEVTAPRLVRVMPVPNREYESGKSAQGMTVMALVIGADGIADQIRVLHSHGSSDDQAAMAALKMSNFEPGKIGDKPVPVRVDARVVFKAKESTAIPEIFIGERDYAAPRESFFEDKKHRPAAYTPPVIIHMVDADLTQPSAGDSIDQACARHCNCRGRRIAEGRGHAPRTGPGPR